MLRLTIQRLQDVTVFRCAGRLTFGHAETLRMAVLTHPRITKAVLDLADVSSLDAAGLGVLLSLRAWAQQSETAFKLMNSTPNIEKIFKLTQLSSAFDICSAREMLDLLCRALRQGEVVEVPQNLELYAAARQNLVAAHLQ